jgi:preprotein translocase subunit YajC
MFVYRITMLFHFFFKQKKKTQRQERNKQTKQLVVGLSVFTKCITVILRVKLITILCFENKYGDKNSN